MTCDAIRNRLLAWPELSGLPDDLRAHLAGCEACTAWAAKARQLDRLLAVLPAPDSAESKAAFVDYLTADGPIIKAVPLVDHPKRFSFGTWSRKLDWRVVSGLAAAALVGVGYWGFSGNGKPGTEVAGPKHELLARGVDFAAAMSTARTTQDRARLSVTMAGNLRDEVKDLYTVAPAEDLDKLADLYEKVVQRGLVHQSEELVRLSNVEKRHELWQQVRGHLADVARDAAVMQTTAPTKAKPPLERIRLAALAGQGKVDRLIANGGAAP